MAQRGKIGGPAPLRGHPAFFALLQAAAASLPGKPASPAGRPQESRLTILVRSKFSRRMKRDDAHA